MKFGKTISILTCSALVSASAFAFAHDGATGIVKERMDGMSAMGKALKSISEMVNGSRVYDADAVREFAEQIRSHSGASMIKLFPKGSMQHASEAKLEIWAEWERFSDLAMELEAVAQSLVDKVEGEINDAALKQVTDACAVCHKDYRQKK